MVRVNPKSRREHLTVPTPKGQKMTEAALDVLTQYHTPMMELLTEKERQQMTDMLAKFHDYICATGKPFACDKPFNI